MLQKYQLQVQQMVISTNKVTINSKSQYYACTAKYSNEKVKENKDFIC